MRNRNHKINVSNAITSYFLFCNFYTTTVTYDAFVSNTLVFTTVTFVIFDGSENAFTKQTAHFWLVASIVDGFWFYHLTKTTTKYNFRGCKRDSHLAKVAPNFLCFLLNLHGCSYCGLIQKGYF